MEAVVSISDVSGHTGDSHASFSGAPGAVGISNDDTGRQPSRIDWITLSRSANSAAHAERPYISGILLPDSHLPRAVRFSRSNFSSSEKYHKAVRLGQALLNIL